MPYASHGHHEKGFVSINFKGVVMGMRIGGGQQAWSSQSSSVSNWQQRQQNFKALGSALQSGDLAGAQQAFATITANNPAAANNPSSPLAQIGQALQSGNLAGAQQAAQTWRGQHGGGAAQANASDAASPMPRLAPVTMMTLPERLPMNRTPVSRRFTGQAWPGQIPA